MGTWYLLLVSILASLVTGALSVTIALRVQQAGDRRFCDLVVAQDDAYTSSPPSTPTGRQVAASIHKLRRDLGCP